MITFYDGLFTKTLEIMKEAHDCADILHDLDRIGQAKANVHSYGGVFAADQLDRELRQKYPMIDVMLNIADAMRSNPLFPPQDGQARSEEEKAVSNLQQDYCGILCDTAVKKGVKQSIKDCIKDVN